jgi:hypothetical protein
MSGVIPSGWGWEYVLAAYGVTAAVFLAYGASVVIRYRNERRREGKA